MLKRLLPVIVLLAATSLQAAEAPPVQVASPHFTVITDAGEKEARRILDNFERMRWVFQTLFPKANVDPATPIVVIAMKNRKGFQALEPPAYLAKNQLNLAGLFMKTQDMNYMLLRLDAEFEHPYSSVYHEYTHLQYSSAQEWMPLWLFEGIAEFFQNTDIHSKDAEVGEPNPNDIFFLRQNALIPLETLFRVDPSSPYYHEEDKGSIFYAESWALTHYLIMSDRIAHTDHLGEYLKLVSQNADPVAAATQAFGDLKSLKTALGYYIAQGQLKQFVMNSGTAIDESAYKVTPLTHNAFDVARAGFLVDVGRTKDAQALLEAVLQTDPKDAGAHETMGFLEFREGDRVAARKWYGEALQLDSQSYLAHFYFAMLSLGDRGSESAEIESNLRASIQIKPDFAPGYDQLAAYLGQKHKDLDEAQKLNLKAVQLDRSNLGYRINAANLMEERDRWDEAQKVLESCLKLARNPADTAMVQNRLEQLAAMRKYASARPQNTAAPAGSVATATVELSANGALPKPITVAQDTPPRHPAESPTGPKHTILGVIRNVKCEYPSTMDLQVEVAAKPATKSQPRQDAKTVKLYTGNYYKLDLSALGFEPKSEMSVCTDIEGMKAQVQYADSSDKTVDGQAIAIELRK